MSNLAPFVAAVLRDHTVQELIDENNRLREQQRIGRDILMFRVTGRNGTPVYYEKLVTNVNDDIEDCEWGLGLSSMSRNGDEITGITVPWETFSNDLEFRLGDVVINKSPIRYEDFDFFGCLVINYENNPLLYTFLELKPGRDRIFKTEMERVFRLNDNDIETEMYRLHKSGEIERMLDSGDLELSITAVYFNTPYMLDIMHGAVMKLRNNEEEEEE